MNSEKYTAAEGYAKRRRQKRWWLRAVSGLACAVVFCTVYALILPAITMERKAQCGQEEHTHTEACYTQVTQQGETLPVCTPEALGIHRHTAACRGPEGEYVCGYADFVIHRHDSACYDAGGVLWCPLPEVEEHVHSEACRAAPESEPEPEPMPEPEPEPEPAGPVHTHTEDCYTLEQGELTCTLPETEGHAHSDACWQETKVLLCELPESEGHVHGDACRDETGALICGQEESEGHTHGDACWEVRRELVCQQEETPAHQHTEACYAQNKVLTCTLPTEAEAPAAGPAPEEAPQGPLPAEEAPAESICGREEIVPHAHTAECFSEAGSLICGKMEILTHQHTGACFQTVEAEPELTCTIPEGEGTHAHTAEAGCYDETGGLICQLEETEGHRHGPMCYGVWELTCGLEEHTHSEDCFLREGLTEEEWAQIDGVNALLDALPGREEIEGMMAELAEAGDEEARDAYLTQLIQTAQEAQAAYDALTDAQREKVTGAQRLEDLAWLLTEGLPEKQTDGLAITTEGGGTAAAEPWLGSAELQARLAADLLANSYTLKAVRYYTVSGLAAGTTATVTYDPGELAADNRAKIFVYALGADGAGEPQSCAVSSETQKDGFFTSFAFAVPTENPDSVYAFVSAAPSGLEELGVYPGKKVNENNDRVWVAYDTGDEETANVKVTITLPEDAAIQENCYPFVSEVKPGEAFYPTEKAIEYAVGEVNEGGVQCYKIHWVEVNGDGSYNFDTEMEMGHGKNASVHLEYLKEEARLGGEQGQRKLRVFSSKTDPSGNMLVEISDAVTDVELAADGYNGFTFNVTEPCPYVFLSKKVATCYVKSLMISDIKDGSDPFDRTDAPGNDKSDHNRVVRSYDTITYNMGITFEGRNKEITATEVRVYFEMTLRKSATAARFDTSGMAWLNGDDSSYCIEYLDERDNVIMVMDQDGKYYQPEENPDGSVKVDRYGFSSPDKAKRIFLNAQLNGSQSGSDSYKVTHSAVAKQRLVGYTKIVAEEGQSVLSGTQTRLAAIEVRNADNGEQFMPAFRLWVDGNVNNLGSENHENGAMQPAQPQSGNVVDVEAEARKGNFDHVVTVSAGTNFNLQLKKNGDMSYKNWFDFSTGRAVAEPARTELVRRASLPENHGKSNPAEFTENGVELPNDVKAQYANYRYGRITCYGITLQLYNDTDNNPKTNRAAKGLKGLSLPVGDITFDLNFWSEAKSKVSGQTIDPNQYTAILWDYNENVPANQSYSHTYVDPHRGKVTTPGDGLGNGRRNLYWDGESRSPYAKGAAPSNYLAYHSGCYYGGDWALVDGNDKELKNLTAMNGVASPTVVTGTGADATYHFKVSDYDFDFDDRHFPTQDAGNSGNVTEYGTYARCFSAGCVQVLSVFPMVQEVSEAEIFLNTEVSNLRLTTRAGQVLAPADGGDGISHEVNKGDNTARDQIVLYAPGNLTKGSSFNGKFNGRVPNSTSEGFLGTEYWSTAYDCSAFAGDDIWIISYGMMNPGSDYRMRSMNLLQLFDSRALSVRDDPTLQGNFDPAVDKEGVPTFLYAADPGYPQGYDTNTPGVLTYMNGVREEDLVYTSTKPDENGYIKVSGEEMKCVGVLMELRGCDLLGGKYQYMRIPVKVNGSDESLVGKTVATVNTVRVWSYDLEDISWANGVWDKRTGKNTLDGYQKPEGGYDNDRYSGELANGHVPPNYVKTEYNDGLQVTGTHAGGTLAGNSLLILSYKAHINMTVDNKQNISRPTYIQDEGQTMVDYRLNNIKTELSDPTGQTSAPTTGLTIKAVLDEERESGSKRISVFRGSYYMYTSVNAGQGGEKVPISDDPLAPTELTFTDADSKPHTIRVYAEVEGLDEEAVTFRISGAPVGIQLPDIVFQARFAEVSALKNNDRIRAGVYISGQGDNRAYDHAKGNTDNITVHVALNGGTNLTKAVNTKVIELNGKIVYTVSYKNSGSQAIPTMYLYDLLPAVGDIRATRFDGDLTLSKVAADAKDGESTVYCSTTGYQELYQTVRVFGGTWSEEQQNAENMNADKVDQMLASGKNNDDEPLFTKLTTNSCDDPDRLKGVTGLYVVVKNLGPGETFTLTLTMETKDNEAGNLYGNLANSWLPGAGTVPIASNQVQTRVIERSISGVVWYDKDLNGARDDGEALLSGVTVTLLKKEKGQYAPCTQDVTGAAISSSVTTRADGAYSFGQLAAGEYIVAFSGNVLESYTGPTAYRQARVASSIDSDGVLAKELKISGFDPSVYAYAIRYSVGEGAVTMKPLAEITGNRQWEDHLDLGLVITGPELPMTGGSGTAGYVLGGIVLMAGAALGLARRRKYIKSCQSKEERNNG